MAARIGVDVGGTNTDAVLLADDAIDAAVKRPPTRSQQLTCNRLYSTRVALSTSVPAVIPDDPQHQRIGSASHRAWRGVRRAMGNGVVMGIYRNAQIRFSRTRFGSFLTRNVVFRLDRFIYRRSGGRFVSTGKPVFPIMLVTMTGRKSGQPRTLPLIYLRDGERLIAFSGDARARGGSRWPRNLLANPRVSVQLDSHVASYVARRATDTEFASYWPKVRANYPPYATYAQRSGESMMFVLEPAVS